jgi:hypothetical protein
MNLGAHPNRSTPAAAGEPLEFMDHSGSQAARRMAQARNKKPRPQVDILPGGTGMAGGRSRRSAVST